MKTPVEISKYLEWDYYYHLNDKHKWILISQNPVQYSEEFLEEFFDKLDWESVIHFKKLSSEFIDKHYDYLVKKVSLANIAYYQFLTQDFIVKHYKSFNKSIYNFDIWESIIKMNKNHISKDFLVKYMSKDLKDYFELTGRI